MSVKDSTSIHPLAIPVYHFVGAGANHSLHSVRGAVPSGQVASQSQGLHRDSPISSISFSHYHYFITIN